MSRWQRRYEVLLPLHFNDGHAVPDELIAQTLLELEQRFRAISCETQVIQGIWENKGQTSRDELVRQRGARGACLRTPDHARV